MADDLEAGDAIGRRVAEYRKLKGLSQRELAARTGYSLSIVEKTERGVRSVERYSVLHTFARALSVDVTELTGAPGKLRKAQEHSAVPEIRRILLSTSRQTDEPVRSVADLRADVARSVAARQAGKYARFAASFPAILDGLRRTRTTTSGSGLPGGVSRGPAEVDDLLAELLHAGSMLLRRLGYVDLAWIAVQQARSAAEDSEDELLALANNWHLSELNLRTGNSAEARFVAERSIDQLDGLLSRSGPSPRVLSMIGTFHLVRAMISAQESSRPGVTQALEEAAGFARRNGRDRDDCQTLFGPSNVAAFGVSTAVELGDGAAAVRLSRRLSPDRIPSRERQARYLVDVARAYAQTGKPDAALQALLDAQKRAPEYLLNHVMAREVVSQLLARERRSVVPGLRTMAKKMSLI